MDVPAPDPRAAARAEQQSGLHEVMAAAQAWFVERLTSAEGAKARAYLATRGFDPHTAQRFGFGYAPEGRQALKVALGGRFPEAMLIEAGLRIEAEGKEPYDRFRGRLMLPIEDARGRVIAFGGRILDAAKTDAPKYLNSPDTPLFDKGRTLYNLHRAGPAARRAGRIVVVEGYMDTIALAAAGIEEAVAPLGTALTERQIELLWRVTEAPVLCFDGDAAGQRAAMRAATRALPLLRPGHTLRFVQLPQGLDPDDLIRQQGKSAIEGLLEAPAPLIELIWRHERDAQPLATPEDKAGLKARLMTHADAVNDPEIKALYRRELAARYSDYAFPRREWRSGGRPFPVRGGGTAASPDPARLLRATGGGARDALAGAVAAGLLRFPGEIARHADALAAAGLADPQLGALIEAHDGGAPLDSATAAPISRGQGLKFAFLDPDADPAAAKAALAQAVALLVERPALDAALGEATRRFERDLSDAAYAEQQRLLKRKLDFDARLRQMAGARMAAPSGQPTNTTAE